MKVLAVMLALCALPAQAAKLEATAATLNAVLARASGGDTVLLAPGVYAAWAPKGLAFSPAVTLTSADPAHRAVFTNFEVRDIKGVTFSNLEMAAQAPGYFVFQLTDVTDVHFDRVDVHGSLDGDPRNDAEGIRIVGGRNVSIVNSEFHELKRAVAISTSTGVKVSGNRAHDLQVTGFMFAAATQVSITDNVIWNLNPVAGDHPDAIQFLTAGTTTPSTDITISGNVIYRGEGGATQGIFLRDQVGTLPYERVAISDNLVVGTGYNGILVMGAKGLSMTGNELVSNPGKTNNTWLRVESADGVTVRRNRAQLISFDKSSNIEQQGNHQTSPVSDGGAAALRLWSSGHPELADTIRRLAPK